jgi:hypothetical protein
MNCIIRFEFNRQKRNIVFVLLDISLASDCKYSTSQPLKMELTEGSETSANYNPTPGKSPKNKYNIQNMAKV